jgi:hypothetical protein
MLRLPLLAATCLLTAQAQPPQPATTPAAREAMQSGLGQALQGNMRSALAGLRSVPDDQFAGPAATIRTCVLARFGGAPNDGPAPELPPTAARALTLYRAYWRAGLLDPASRPIAEARLRTGLASLLGLPAATDLDAMEAPLAARLEAEHVHVLSGVTPPFRELMLWRGQTEEQRDVALPEGAHRIRVFMLDDFASLGWAGYATCERSHTGGWVRPEGIYAVRSGWGDLADEAFRISFLAHETQHFADKQRFGELSSWELEYRAKLTELALAETNQTLLLDAFAHSQSDDQAVPHPYANRRVLAALRVRLGLAPDAPFGGATPDAIRAAARAELLADSARRQPIARRPG